MRTSEQIIRDHVMELTGLIKSRDFLIERVKKSRARESEKAMTLSKYEREKAALRHVIELLKGGSNVAK